jgi:hypothetical protein
LSISSWAFCSRMKSGFQKTFRNSRNTGFHQG